MGLFPTITNLTFFLCAMKLDKTFDKTVRAGVRNYVPSWIKHAVWCAFYYNVTLYRRRRTYCFSFTWKRWNASIMYAQPRTPRGICIHYDGSMGMRGAKCALGHKWSCSLLLVYHRLWSWWKDYLQTWILPCPQNIPNWKSFLKRSKSHNALSTYKVYTSRLNRHLNWVNNLF